MGLGSSIKKYTKKGLGIDIKDVGMAAINPVFAAQLIAGGLDSEAIEGFLDDPFGQQSTADQATRLAELSAQEGIQSLTDQQQQIEELYGGYYDRGQEGLSTLESMSMGDYEHTPSKLYEYEKETGERSIRRRQAARGMLGSTGTEQRLAGFYEDIADKDIERAYQGELSKVQIGQAASDKIASGEATTAANVGSLYQTLGDRTAQISQGYGEARSALYQGAANALGGLSTFMAQRG